MKTRLGLTTSEMTLLALLLALTFILSSFGINSRYITFTLAFLPIIFIARIGGPFWTAVLLSMNDILLDLFHGWPLNPLFTVSATVSGLIYGIFYYQRKLSTKSFKDWAGVLGITGLITLISTIFLNSFALSIQNNLSFKLLLLLSLPNLFAIPLMTVIILLVIPMIQNYI